jgi:hypothetical protein
MSADIWVVATGTAPSPASPTLSGLTEDITSSASNINLSTEYVYSTIKVPLANLSATTKTITLVLARLGSSANDTYGGTLQISSVIAYQAAS